MDDLGKALKEHILVLDGAVGTELMRRGGRGCLEAMVLDNEAAVAAVHESYLDAGADIVTTDTLCADALCLEHHGLSERSYEIARRAAEIARACVERYSAGSRRRFVAGSVGPSTRNISLANDITEDGFAQCVDRRGAVPSVECRDSNSGLGRAVASGGACGKRRADCNIPQGAADG